MQIPKWNVALDLLQGGNVVGAEGEESIEYRTVFKSGYIYLIIYTVARLLYTWMCEVVSSSTESERMSKCEGVKWKKKSKREKKNIGIEGMRGVGYFAEETWVRAPHTNEP